jgi:hypothetical protein
VIITYIHASRLEDQIRAQFRCRNLADAINRIGAHHANLLDIRSFLQNTPEAQKMCAESDLLVIYRYLYGPILKMIQYWKARDKKIIVDFDQALTYLTPDIPDYSFWLAGAPLATIDAKAAEPGNLINPVPLEQFKYGLGIVDAATVPSARLADDWSQFTNCHVLPDYLNTCQYPIMDTDHDNETWIGLGQNVQNSSLMNSSLAAALEDVCRKRPQVRLILCDQGKSQIPKLNIDPTRVLFFSPFFFDEWVSLLLKLDIGLIPVAGDYDLRLSQVSMLEFMIAKIPWIATEQLAFHHLLQYGYWVPNSTETWKTAILKAVDHLEAYQKKAGRESFLFALGQDVGANIDKTLRIYSSVLNHS